MIVRETFLTFSVANFFAAETFTIPMRTKAQIELQKKDFYSPVMR